MSAYVIGQLRIDNPDDYQEYLDGFLPCLERHGGELLATSKEETILLEGDWSLPRTVLMRFPKKVAAKAWFDDPDYQAIAKVRRRTAQTNLVIVDGID